MIFPVFDLISVPIVGHLDLATRRGWTVHTSGGDGGLPAANAGDQSTAVAEAVDGRMAYEEQEAEAAEAGFLGDSSQHGEVVEGGAGGFAGDVWQESLAEHVEGAGVQGWQADAARVANEVLKQAGVEAGSQHSDSLAAADDGWQVKPRTCSS